MTHKHSGILVVFSALVILACAALPGRAQAEPPISDPTLTLTAKSPTYVGVCPKTFGFKGIFKIQHPNAATFYFEKSDGTQSRTYSFTSAISPKIFMNTWVFAWPINKSGQHWVKMHVMSGNTHIVSEPAYVSVTCQ